MTAVDVLYEKYLNVSVVLSVDDSAAGFFMGHMYLSFPSNIIYQYNYTTKNPVCLVFFKKSWVLIFSVAFYFAIFDKSCYR